MNLSTSIGKLSSLVLLMFALNYISITKSQFRYHQNDAFGFGERLDYKVRYGFIVAGEGYLHILPKAVYRNGRECYDIRFQVNSLKSLEWIYRVRDWYSTVLDVQGIFPWEFEQHIREGNYKRDFKAIFDQENNFALAEGKKYKVPTYVHDIVSAFYYTRTLPINKMPKDTVFYLYNFFKDTTYQLGVKILGKQTVEVPVGKFRCVVVEPLVVEGGLFKSEGSIYIWLTDDDRKNASKSCNEDFNWLCNCRACIISRSSGSFELKSELKLKVWKPHIFSDFDGTITLGDVCIEIIENFGQLEPFLSKLASGEIKLRDFWYKTLRTFQDDTSIEDLITFTKESTNVDPYFYQFIMFCKENFIPFEIISDGFDFYIQAVLEKLKLQNIRYYANSIVKLGNFFNPVFTYANDSCWCENVGSCKRNIALSNLRDDEVLIYIGDGYSDFCIVEYSDIVFAKGILSRYCNKNRIPHYNYKTFYDVQLILKKFLQNQNFKPRQQARLKRKKAFEVE